MALSWAATSWAAKPAPFLWDLLAAGSAFLVGLVVRGCWLSLLNDPWVGVDVFDVLLLLPPRVDMEMERGRSGRFLLVTGVSATSSFFIVLSVPRLPDASPPRSSPSPGWLSATTWSLVWAGCFAHGLISLLPATRVVVLSTVAGVLGFPLLPAADLFDIFEAGRLRGSCKID